METSLELPTATSVRSVPAKLMIDNRIVINSHLKRSRGGKVSFTHLVGYAMVRALADMPAMNAAFDVVDGKPTLVKPVHINLGLAIDMAKDDGTRQLLVPSIKNCESMDFAEFWHAYEAVIRRARAGSSRSRTSRARRSRSRTPARSGPCTQSRAWSRVRARSSGSAHWSTRPSSRARPRTR